MSEFNFKDGDRVYCPTVTNKIVVVNSKLYIQYIGSTGDKNTIAIFHNGKWSDHHHNPIAFPATQEWYERLSHNYPNLEKPPIKKAPKNTIQTIFGDCPMTNAIKPNDLVYIPSETNILQRVIRDKDSLIVDDGYNRFTINEQGCKYDFNVASWGTQPFAFLAAPEMKEKLEQIYGKLEDIPVDEEVELFKEMLDIALYETEKGNFNKEKHFDELVQLFKERGSK